MKLLTAALVLTILGVILAVPMESTGAYRRHSRQSDIESGPNNEASTSRGSNTPSTLDDIHRSLEQGQPYMLTRQEYYLAEQALLNCLGEVYHGPRRTMTPQEIHHVMQAIKYSRDSDEYHRRRNTFRDISEITLPFEVEHFLQGWAWSMAPFTPERAHSIQLYQELLELYGPCMLDVLDRWLKPMPEIPDSLVQRNPNSGSQDPVDEQYHDIPAAQEQSSSLRHRRQGSHYGPRH